MFSFVKIARPSFTKVILNCKFFKNTIYFFEYNELCLILVGEVILINFNEGNFNILN